MRAIERYRRQGLTALLCLVACSAATAQQSEPQAPVAFVTLAQGQTEARRADGTVRPLAADDLVQAGETLVTGTDGWLSLEFQDGERVFLRPASVFTIEQHVFDEERAVGEAFFRLLKGGFRAITGLIGHHSRERYAVATTVATIGVRGTDYEVRLCQSDCEVDGRPEEDGLYAAVDDGEIALVNEAGEWRAGAGAFGLLKDRRARWQALRDRPRVLALERRRLDDARRQELRELRKQRWLDRLRDRHKRRLPLPRR